MEFITGYLAIFIGQMKGFFLSEDSRMWWAWILITYPLVGMLVGAIEMRRNKEPITITALFKFVFPAKIYKSLSFRNDVLIVGMLFVFYSVVLLVFSSLGATVILGKMIGLFNSETVTNSFVGPYKDTVTAGLGLHLFFTFLVILVYDFGFTYLHFLYHRVPFLWNMHKVHHSAEHLTPLTVARFHLGEYVLQKVAEGLTLGLIFGVFYFILPSSISLIKVFGLSIFGILFSSIGVFRHSHIWISYGWLSYIFCSPAMHQIHHSTEARHIDKNFSQVFSFWDYLLGSLYVPKERETFDVGLVGEKDWNSGSWRKFLGVHLKAK